jgi:integrase
MVVLQWLTGMRPSEVFNMRVENIDRTRGNGLWYHVLKDHKTKRHIGKKPIPLGKDAQALIAPYLEGKSPEQAVFSPITAMEERNAERRANRKTKISPSQAARNAARAAKPKNRRNEFYNENSYGKAVEYAIRKGNKNLPEDQKIPHWFPYQLRHSASTDIELEHGIDASQAMLGHRTANTTKRYSHGQLAKAEKIARNRQNPFDTNGQSKDVA